MMKTWRGRRGNGRAGKIANGSNMPNIANPEFDAFVKNKWEPYIRDAKLSWYVDERIARQHILPEFAQFKLLDITAEYVKAWYHTLLAKGLAVTTCNRILYVLKNIFNFASKNGFLKNRPNPLDAVCWVKTGKKQEKILQYDNVEGIFARLKESGKIEAKVILLLIYSGAAKNEILRAKWENYFPEKNLLLAESQRGRKHKEIWLPVEAADILARIEKLPGCPWIFPGRDKNKPLSDIFWFWNGVRNQCGLRNLKINEFRINYIRYNLINGVNMNQHIVMRKYYKNVRVELNGQSFMST